MSASDAVILLVADGLVAVGRVLGGFRRRSGWERQAQAVDALNALEDNQDGLEPGQLTKAQQAAMDLGLSLADRAVAYGDQICAAYMDAFKPPPDFIAQRSAAVTVPAADNTTEGCLDCAEGTCQLPAGHTSQRAADNTTDVDHLEAAWHYHRPQANYNGDLVWGCEGCNWSGRTIQAHSRHRFHVLADMKNATHRIQEQLGGAS